MAYLNVFEENEIIIRENEENKYLYMVKSGTVALYMNYGKKNETLLGLCGKNKVFGETGAILDQESPYTAVTYDEAEVMKFSKDELGAFMKGYPDQVLGMFKSLARVNKLLRINCEMLIDEINEYKKEAVSVENPRKGYDVSRAYAEMNNKKEDIKKEMSKVSLGYEVDKIIEQYKKLGWTKAVKK